MRFEERGMDEVMDEVRGERDGRGSRRECEERGQ